MAKKKVSDAALDVLKKCSIDGTIVRLPEGQLERELYEEVKKLLTMIGGKWKGGKTQGFVFDIDPTELLNEQANGEGRDLKQEYQFFATPEELAKRMASLLPHCRPGTKNLEPSAGDGALVKALLEYHGGEVEVDCFEILDVNKLRLKTVKGANIIGDDFLKAGIEGWYDNIIANPPFTKNQDIDHIMAMYKALKTNGRMVVIASKSWTFGSQKKQVEFREWLTKVEAVQEEIPAETFKSSGTNVATMLLVIDKLEAVEKVTPPKVLQIPAQKSPVKRGVNNRNMSKVSFNTSALEEALSKAKEVVDTKSVLPVTLNVLLDVTGTKARFVCTDITVTLQVDISCENPENESFKVLIPFDFLYGVVKLNKNQQLELETNTSKLILKGINDNYEVNVLDDVKDFPAMPEFPEGNALELAVDVIPAISAAIDTISKETLRPSMCTVCLHLEQGQIHVVSTNSNVLYRKTFVSDAYNFDNQELLISPKVVKLLNGFGNTTITWSEHHIAFTSNNVTVITKTLAEKYPAYTGVIPINPEVNLVCNRAQLIDAISKAMLATDSTNRCNFLLKQQIGRVKIEGVDRDRDRNIHVELPVDFEGDCEQVAVSGLLMLTLLKQVNYEDIGLCISNYKTAIILKSYTDEGYTGLIMPLSVNN